MTARQVFLMVREPQAGRVKTRLGTEIGMTDAAWWYRHQVARMIRRLECPKWSFTLAIAPDTAFASPVWPLRIPRIAQGRGDLGQRMSGLFGSGLTWSGRDCRERHSGSRGQPCCPCLLPPRAQ